MSSTAIEIENNTRSAIALQLDDVDDLFSFCDEVGPTHFAAPHRNDNLVVDHLAALNNFQIRMLREGGIWVVRIGSCYVSR